MLLFLHLLAVSLWLGGQLFLLLIVVPVVRTQPAEQAAPLIRRVGQRFLVISIPVLLLILATGVLMAADRRLFDAPGGAFDAKLVAVAVVLVSTVAHIIAARRGLLTASRIATAVTGVATIAAVWFAVHI